jgi:2-polyprenyl-3-methyl-5-hydroxy-6-metoxy-1,4-benzoquinol methylase
MTTTTSPSARPLEVVIGPQVALVGTSPPGVPTPAELCAGAKRLYTTGPRPLRLLQHYRPYVCPFGQLMSWVARGGTVLDVGCGGGLWLGLLAQRGHISRGLGFDAAAPVVDLARSMAEGAGLSSTLEFLHLPVERPWPDERFDAVSIIDVLHHVPPAFQADVITTAAGKVRPGGRLIIKDIAPDDHVRALANRLHDLALARQWVRYITRDAVIAAATGAGLRLEHTRRVNTLWYGHDLCVFSRPVPGNR